LRAYDPTKTLISIHIPKTAGTSFAEVLRQWFGDELTLQYPDKNREMPPPRASMCIHGHFNRLRGGGISPRYPSAEQFVTFLRNPFDRFVSQWLYLHFQREAGWPVPDAIDNFDTWLRYRRDTFAAGNDPFSMLAHLPEGAPLDSFIAIGITERYRESIAAIADTLGKPQPKIIPGLNRAKTAMPDIEKYRTDHERWFTLEYAVYGRANKLLSAKNSGEKCP
jgi:hypothetical protein